MDPSSVQLNNCVDPEVQSIHVEVLEDRGAPQGLSGVDTLDSRAGMASLPRPRSVAVSANTVISMWRQYIEHGESVSLIFALSVYKSYGGR